jgi:RNA polymerase sigma-70 factor (ECF subfamily)
MDARRETRVTTEPATLIASSISAGSTPGGRRETQSRINPRIGSGSPLSDRDCEPEERPAPRTPDHDQPRPTPALSTRDAILSAIPGLRAFAMSLCRNVDRADDLVQETLLRALTNINSFEPGTNLRGWLTTILRNQYLSEARKHRREVEDTTGSYADTLRSIPEQDARIAFDEFLAALATLPLNQQEVLLLVGGLGLRNDEAAAICGTGVATIRSRIFRARTRLKELLPTVGNEVDPHGSPALL